MKKTKKEKLEDAGWRVGSAADFLELSPEEAALVEIRMTLARCIRNSRKRMRLSQAKVAQKIGSSQSRVAKMEKADPSVSLDLMFRSAIALGNSRQDLGRLISSEAA